MDVNDFQSMSIIVLNVQNTTSNDSPSPKEKESNAHAVHGVRKYLLTG